jgi:hypothetical protein
MSVAVVSQFGLMIGASSGLVLLRLTVPRLDGETTTTPTVRIDPPGGGGLLVTRPSSSCSRKTPY